MTTLQEVVDALREYGAQVMVEREQKETSDSDDLGGLALSEADDTPTARPDVHEGV